MTNDTVSTKDIHFNTHMWYLEYLHSFGNLTDDPLRPPQFYPDEYSKITYIDGYKQQKLEEYGDELAVLEKELGEIKLPSNSEDDFIFDIYGDDDNVASDPIWTFHGHSKEEKLSSVNSYGWRFRGGEMSFKSKDGSNKFSVNERDKFPKLQKECSLENWRKDDDSAYVYSGGTHYLERSKIKKVGVFMIKCPIKCPDCFKVVNRTVKTPNLQLENCKYTAFGVKLIKLDRWLDTEVRNKRLQFDWIERMCDGKIDPAELDEDSYLTESETPTVSDLEKSI